MGNVATMEVLSRGFAKLDIGIVDSTIWCMSHEHLRVWIAMLAKADASGLVRVAAPMMAHLCLIDLDRFLQIASDLCAPDEYSRTPDNDGRRLESVNGGWIVLNYRLYRDSGTRSASNAERQAKYRARHQSGTHLDSNEKRNKRNKSNARNKSNNLLPEAEAEAEAEKKLTNVSKEKLPCNEIAQEVIPIVEPDCLDAPIEAEIVRREPSWWEFSESVESKIVREIRLAKGYAGFDPPIDRVESLVEKIREWGGDDDAIDALVIGFTERADARRLKTPEYTNPLMALRKWAESRRTDWARRKAAPKNTTDIYRQGANLAGGRS